MGGSREWKSSVYKSEAPSGTARTGTAARVSLTISRLRCMDNYSSASRALAIMEVNYE